jgi:hypothetical protein
MRRLMLYVCGLILTSASAAVSQNSAKVPAAAAKSEDTEQPEPVPAKVLPG